MTFMMPSVASYPMMPLANEEFKTRKSKNESFGFKVDEDFARQFEDFAARTGRTYTDIIRKGIEAQINPQLVQIKDDGPRTFTAPYLSAVPCGPWGEAIDRAERFQVSIAVADELEARDGDVWVRADGQSMEGVGIVDGFLVLIRPMDGKTPRRNDILLVQVSDEDNNCLGTIKRFDGLEKDGKTPRLIDAEGKVQALPESLSSVDYIGRAVGVVGRL